MLSILVLMVVGPVSFGTMNVLVFSKTAGYRHDCIEAGQQMFSELANEHGFAVSQTESGAAFTLGNLKQHSVVVFLCTTGDVLTPEQQTAFQTYVEEGGGYLGIHSASDTEYGWPWYEKLVGAWFLSHPQIQKAKILNEVPKDPIMSPWPVEFERADEWYDFRTNPRPNVQVLASVEQASYEGSKMPGNDHPIVWKHPIGAGRSFYTGFGHTKETYLEAPFRQMIYRALLWTASKS